jgi:hypothetical protein
MNPDLRRLEKLDDDGPIRVQTFSMSISHLNTSDVYRQYGLVFFSFFITIEGALESGFLSEVPFLRNSGALGFS